MHTQKPQAAKDGTPRPHETSPTPKEDRPHQKSSEKSHKEQFTVSENSVFKRYERANQSSQLQDKGALTAIYQQLQRQIESAKHQDHDAPGLTGQPSSQQQQSVPRFQAPRQQSGQRSQGGRSNFLTQN